MQAQPQYFAIALRPVPSESTTLVLRRRLAGTEPPVPARETLVLRQRPMATEPPPVPSRANLLRTTETPPVPARATEVLEAKLLAILDSPIHARETPTQGFDRKERDLGNAFAELTRDRADALLERLLVNYTCDVLARKFDKLSEERRERLIGFLGHCAMTR